MPRVDMHQMRGYGRLFLFLVSLLMYRWMCMTLLLMYIRPVAFLGLGAENPFSLPSCEKVIPRLKGNLQYFSANYILVTLVIGMFTAISNFMFLLSSCALAYAWNQVLDQSQMHAKFKLQAPEAKLNWNEMKWNEMNWTELAACVSLCGQSMKLDAQGVDTELGPIKLGPTGRKAVSFFEVDPVLLLHPAHFLFRAQ